MNRFRVIPSIEHLRQRDAIQGLEAEFGRDAVIAALRETTARVRVELGDDADTPPDEARVISHIESGVSDILRHHLAPSLRPVINATGVIVHTNLGRAPLTRRAVERVVGIASYANLELDLETGLRGSRSAHARGLLERLTGAERAAVVNNNAAAVLLTLAALSDGKEVIISRGELVEIGGGFRIPDVLQQSGAVLREVGTTNRTRAADYAAAVSDETGLILRVHPSNFRIEGFAERPALDEVVDIGHRLGIPVVEDLGSGNFLEPGDWPDDSEARWDEPTVRASVSAGVDVCCFSGDKLLGGPQAGIIVGRHSPLEVIERHPLMRALRADKLVYAALEATLLEYATGRAPETVPVAQMIRATVQSLESRADRIIEEMSPSANLAVSVVPGRSTIGGGTTPGMTLPSRLLCVVLQGASADALARYLRKAAPPVVGRIEHDSVVLDLRTIRPDEDQALVGVLRRLALLDAASAGTDGAPE